MSALQHAQVVWGTISRLMIFPVGPFGSSSAIHILRGYLYAAT